MLTGAPDHHAPPADLDVPAARTAEAHFDAALRRGSREDIAWAEAVETFRLHHPAWPRPLAEREAARVIGALVGWRRAAREGARAHPAPPQWLLRRLADLTSRTPSALPPEVADLPGAPRCQPVGARGGPAGTTRALLPTSAAAVSPDASSPAPRA